MVNPISTKRSIWYTLQLCPTCHQLKVIHVNTGEVCTSGWQGQLFSTVKSGHSPCMPAEALTGD